MAEALQGIDTVLLFRVLLDETTKSGAKLAFQTEHELTETRDADSTTTKDGAIVTPSALETTIDCTSILAKDDELAKDLRTALRKYQKVEIWEVNISEPETPGDPDTKYSAMYFQGYVNEWSKNPTAEDAIELSVSFTVEGEGQEGFATLTAEQQTVVQYVFRDTTPVTP